MVDEDLFQKFMGELEVDEEIRSFVRDSVHILPGEAEIEYLEMFSMMVLDLDPENYIEWLCAIDLASLFWEVQRYRGWRVAIIKANRAAALTDAIYRTDPNYRLLGDQPAVKTQARADAISWHTDQTRRNELDVRLKENGFNAQGINAQAFTAALVPLASIDRILASTRSQINVLLREINVRREFARRARKVVEKRFELDTLEPAETTCELKKITAA